MADRKLPVIILLVFLALLAWVVPGSAEDRFALIDSSTVLDNHTGLMWYRNAGQEDMFLPVQLANRLVAEINSGKRENYGHKDWRLPTVEEMLSIIDPSKSNPALPAGHPFQNVTPGFYWTITGGVNVAGYAWTVDLSTGAIRAEYASYCTFHNIWPVRTEVKDRFKTDAMAKPSVLPSELNFLVGMGICAESAPKKAPLPPVDVTINVVSDTELLLSWKLPPVTPENPPAAWVNIYDKDTLIQSPQKSPYTLKNLTPGTSKCYTLTSYSESGLESVRTQRVCASTLEDSALGSIWAYGLNNYGQLGDGTSNDADTPVRVAKITEVRRLAAGVEHSAAVGMDGSIWTWGRNTRGQLGDGGTGSRSKPDKISGVTDAIDISLGWYHSIALRSNGTVVAWGRNYYGQLGDASRYDRLAPVQVKNLKNIVKVESGWYHSLALSAEGTLWAWGWDLKGQLGNGSEESNAWIPVEVNVPDIQAMAAGMYHTVALRKDGTLFAWGYNEFGQLGNGSNRDSQLPQPVRGINGVIAIDCGMHYTLALKSDGTVWAWGRNDYGQLGATAGSEISVPTQIKSLSDVKAIAAGAHHGIAIKRDGSQWIWGWDFSRDIKGAPPTLIGGLKGITDASAGLNFTLFLKEK